MTQHEAAPPAQLSDIARTVLKKRYLIKDEHGKVIETPETMFQRVADTIAAVDARYGATPQQVTERSDIFYRLMTQGYFEPNSPTLMNAGRPLGQLSACFVLPIDDDLHSIYETLKHQALIHQSGGGCIAGDSRVWTTFCGIEPIEVLFHRATLDGRQGVQHGAGVAYDVRDLQIHTVAMDPVSGQTGLRQVTHVWRFDVPAAQQIVVTTDAGTVVQTSDWHPFMVLRGTQLVELRADELVPGDVVLGPARPDDFWPWRELRTVGTLTLDTDLGWLIGFTLGNGSFDYVPTLRQYELRWRSASRDGLERVLSVLARYGIAGAIQAEEQGQFSVATLNQRFVDDLLELCGLEQIASQADRLRVPELIAKSPLAVLHAFLAGLIDSEAFTTDAGKPTYATASASLAEDLAALLSLLGYQPAVSSQPNGNAMSVQLCLLAQVADLARDLQNYLVHAARLEQLQPNNQQQTLPVPFVLWSERLAALGLSPASENGQLALELQSWADNADGRCRRDHLAAIARAIAPLDAALAHLLERVANNGQEIAQIEHAAVAKPYYDLTVADWNTYAAGRAGLTMVHNTGFAFSRLRPRNDVVRSTMGVASGPVSFMQVYDHSTEAIKQGGTRRGANMGILAVNHPDILEFITVKQDLTKVTNFNISVAITDAFMQAVKDDVEYDLINPRTGQVQIASREGLKHPQTGDILVHPGQPMRLRARMVFDLIVQCAHATGEPGLFFIDRANEYNPVPHLGQYEATNPCGEQPLLAFDVCNLGSINLGKFVTPEGKIDWDELREVVHQSTRFLDNVIDANHYPLPQIDELSKRIRRIGLGVMGWADMLVRLNVPYNSTEATELGRRVMQFVDEESKIASEQLARERGTFPEWEQSIWGPDATSARRPDGSRIRPERRLRNCNVTTVAPTGTISMIAGCSSGIEPLFAVAFWRYQAETRMLDINEDFVAQAKREGWYSPELMERIADTGHIHHAEVPLQVQRVWVTAHDVSPEWHVRMQAAFQDFTDSAISKTCNFAYESQPDDIRAAYELAFQLGCKGITVYRDGSRSNQVLSTGSTGKPATPATPSSEQKPANSVPLPVRPRPVPAAGLPSHSYPVVTPQGKMRLFVTEMDGEPFEVFAVIGRAGSDVTAFTEAIGRLLSLGLRCGIPVKLLAEQLRGIGGSRSTGFGPDRVRSVPDAIGKLLQEHYVPGHHEQNGNGNHSNNGNGTHIDDAKVQLLAATYQQLFEHSETVVTGEICPECHNATLMNIEGCRKCHTCGYTEC